MPVARQFLLIHLILPGLVLGSLICRAQRSRTPRAVAGTAGKDLPKNPVEMKVELLEEDVAFFFWWNVWICIVAEGCRS